MVKPGRGPLTALSNSTNTVFKASQSVQKNSKPIAVASRQTAPPLKPSTLRPSSVKTTTGSKPTEPAPVSNSEPVAASPIQENQGSPKQVFELLSQVQNTVESFNPNPVKEYQKDSRLSEVNILIKDHENCFEKQRELVAQFKTENQMRAEDLSRLRAEVSRWKETFAQSEAEIVTLKERNQGLVSQHNSNDDNILTLRREVLLLQRKIECSHDAVAQSELETIKLKREISELKGESEELRSQIAKDRAEKEAFWSQLQEENKKYQALLDSNNRYKEESKALMNLVEKMRDEIRMLRNSNEEALRFVMNK
jgi:chromosome segregation ATPase